MAPRITRPSAPRRRRIAPPSLHEVRPGLWCLPIELPGHTVGHVVTYGLVSPRGVVLVDTGWDDEGTLASLDAALRQGPGVRVDDIAGIVATHAHPDHIGLARRIQERSGAWLALHPREADQLESHFKQNAIPQLIEWLVMLGVPESAHTGFIDIVKTMTARNNLVAADHDLVEGDKLAIPDWEITVHHTPGHTPGHICLVVGSAGAVLSGDHILPTIYPSYMVLTREFQDPLGDYLDACRRCATEWQDMVVLPGHGQPFGDIARQIRRVTARIDQRLDETSALVSEGHRTVWQVSQELSWSGGWNSRTIKSKRVALGSTLAYLRHLEGRGTIAARDNATLEFSPA